MDDATHLAAILSLNGHNIAIIANSDDMFLQRAAKVIHQRAQPLVQALVGPANIEAQLLQRRASRIPHFALFADRLLDTSHNLWSQWYIPAQPMQQWEVFSIQFSEQTRDMDRALRRCQHLHQVSRSQYTLASGTRQLLTDIMRPPYAGISL